MPEFVSERVRLAKKISSFSTEVAAAVTEEYFVNHPEMLVRYGERGRKFCTADACFHMEFLSGAVEGGSPEAFADYARWTVRMLDARGVPAHSLEENFSQLDKHLSALLEPAEAAAVSAFLAKGRAACMDPAVVAPVADTDDDGLELTRRVFLAAILSGQRQAAVNIAEGALRAGHSHIDVYVGVFTEALRSVGQLWESNKISVAHEHMATSTTQYVMAAIYPRLVPVDSYRGSMVVTGVSGEMHQIGANLVADSMEAMGWSVRFLGSNLPHASVVSAIQETSADVLCISTTIVANLPSVGELVRTVRSQLSDRTPKIVLGGAAYRMMPHFAEEIGAGEVITDLRTAIHHLCA
jgi:MerR family transcriptional regulator, light-induced transcriptional regulator